MKTLHTMTAALALLVGAGAANGADVYSSGSLKDAPVTAYPVTWTGAYASVGVGGHFVDHALSAPGGFAFDGIAAEGLAGRFGAGFDVQTGKLVFGIFGDYDVSNASTDLTFGSTTASIDMNYLWTAGARFGVLATPTTLIYGLAGYSEGQFEGKGPLSGLGKLTASGYTVGGGVEQQLGMNFSLKGEYRFTGLDTQTIASTVAVNSDVQSVFGSLVYKIPVGQNILH